MDAWEKVILAVLACLPGLAAGVWALQKSISKASDEDLRGMEKALRGIIKALQTEIENARVTERESRAMLQARINEVEQLERLCQKRVKELVAEITTDQVEIGKLKGENAYQGSMIVALQRQIGMRNHDVAKVRARLSDMIILDANNGITAILGWRPAELIGKSVSMLIAMKDRERHEASMKHAAETKTVRSSHLVVRGMGIHKMGHECPVQVVLYHEPNTGEVVAQITKWDDLQSFDD